MADSAATSAHLDFELRQQDVEAAYWAQVRRDDRMWNKVMERRWRMPIVLGSMFMLIGLVTDERWVLGGSLVATAVGVPLAVWFGRWQVRRNVVAEIQHGPNRDCLCRHHVWFDEDGVGNRVDSFEEKVGWGAIKEIVWDDQRGFIFFGTRRMFVVPRDAETAEAFEPFFEALEKTRQQRQATPQ